MFGYKHKERVPLFLHLCQIYSLISFLNWLLTIGWLWDSHNGQFSNCQTCDKLQSHCFLLFFIFYFSWTFYVIFFYLPNVFFTTILAYFLFSIFLAFLSFNFIGFFSFISLFIFSTFFISFFSIPYFLSVFLLSTLSLIT